jgi:hypothetical protein
MEAIPAEVSHSKGGYSIKNAIKLAANINPTQRRNNPRRSFKVAETSVLLVWLSLFNIL